MSVCKKKYQPVGENGRRYACYLHEGFRKKRVIDEGGFRSYEVDLDATFWNNDKTSDDDGKRKHEDVPLDENLTKRLKK